MEFHITGSEGGPGKRTNPKGRWRAPVRPYWAILEDDFDCLLVNARHVKNVPGRKTDLTDAKWLADVAARDDPSELRTPTTRSVSCGSLRYRKTQSDARAAEIQRLGTAAIAKRPE